EFSSFAKLPTAKREPVNLIAVINDVITLYSSYKHIRIVLNNAAGEPFVFADRDQLLRVFNNLVKNGIQAIERGKTGEVSISISKTSSSMVRVDVSDTGIGIPKHAREKIFTPNFTTKSGGTGLGLAITREIILNFGGNIHFTSTENIGTTFTVDLPLYEA
ncbi:sensor histidine kinase, partial [Tenuifilum sp.]|nr:ATP-binding protein [Tenuifilum sp.]HOK87112.1 ATP-binding protein [Tenuifilum sp.]HPP91243.1 ATP-binding protein [Tenuifilum sp.]